MSLSHPSFSFFPSWHDLLSLLIFFPSPSVGSRRIGRSDNGGISFLESATTPPPRILWAWLEYRSKSSIESALPVSQQKLLTYPPPSTRTLFLFLSSGRFDISVWGGKGRREREEFIHSLFTWWTCFSRYQSYRCTYILLISRENWSWKK